MIYLVMIVLFKNVEHSRTKPPRSFVSENYSFSRRERIAMSTTLASIVKPMNINFCSDKLVSTFMLPISFRNDPHDRPLVIIFLSHELSMCLVCFYFYRKDDAKDSLEWRRFLEWVDDKKDERFLGVGGMNKTNNEEQSGGVLSNLLSQNIIDWK